MISRPLARTHDIRNLSYEREVKSRYYAPTDDNRLYRQPMRKCNCDTSSEIVPKCVDFEQNYASSKQRNERKNYMSASKRNDDRNTSSYLNSRYGGKVTNAVYDAEQ